MTDVSFHTDSKRCYPNQSAIKAAKEAMGLLGGRGGAQQTRYMAMQLCLGTALSEKAYLTHNKEMLQEAGRLIGTAAAEAESLWGTHDFRVLAYVQVPECTVYHLLLLFIFAL